ncbi:glycoside hydrolase [Chitiniphilus eburneus]|uniref:Glycoside hydrolase n=1 Tax=Chitiniphilus eburneus TaxID=2571148 RepID=A0A4U0QBZ5_9NEIS|nr:glycoside hydrolase [Chitiniphilus eburneus]TJZ78913.1 glycoside hydrolase [Chitiniphilus eburneus]
MTVLVFHDPQLPFDGTAPDADALAHWRRHAVTADAAQLAEQLATLGAGDAVLHAHGRYFPLAAHPALLAFLQRGGGLVSLGRQPLSQPIHDGTTMAPQAALFRDLDIHEMLAVDAGNAVRLTVGEEFSLLAGAETLFEPGAATDGFVLMPTKHKDQPADSGSAGPMDAHIYPLLLARNAADAPIAAPVVLIERHRGVGAGGRWLFVNVDPTPAFWGNGGARTLLDWASFAAHGATECWLKPDFACYLPGEVPTLTLQLEALSPAASREWRVELTIAGPNGARCFATALTLRPAHGPVSQRLTLPFAVVAGPYAITATLRADDGETRQLRQGFWGWDDTLLTRGSRLKAGRDYFERDGEPLPIVGMTYMASDVHRKFLQLPNVAAWDDDLRDFAALGINYVRTGIWSGWRHAMFVDGHANEAVLRAIDAFILTAARYGLETCFNFFAFTPEAWEGANPYLDPRARAAQKRFIGAVVARHAHSTCVHWDLINEPSLFDPARIFLGPRTLRDPYEVAAFRHWLQTREPELAVWRNRWDVSPTQLPSWDALLPPQPEDIGFNPTEIAPRQHGIWLDYTLFTQAMHNEWAADLTEHIRALTGDALVTVGQDEALGQQRPAPFFYDRVVDYTTVHSWWLNDALAWDTLFNKTPCKPLLIQETGIMHVENPNGRSKRGEAELAALLERKYAYAFAGGGAGAVQWIWNINYHMDNINESHIGAVRADGSRKPETAVSGDFGAFFAKVAPLMRERSLPQVAVVHPYANDYGNRRSAQEATQRLVRVLHYQLGVPLRAVSEYHLDALYDDPASLVLVPSPQALSNQARQQLRQLLSIQPVKVLLTGPASLDEYWNPADSLFDSNGVDVANVMREEACDIDGQRHRAAFGGEKIARVLKGRLDGAALAQVHAQPCGAGTLLWCPLPLELSDSEDTLAALYRHALAQADVTAPLRCDGGIPHGIYLEKLPYAQGALWIAVNESALNETLSVHDARQGYCFELPAGRALLFATDAQGAVLASLRDQPVACLS